MLLHDLLSAKRLILASGSPRRRELLTMADLPFTLAEPFEADESFPADMEAERVPAYLAIRKSNFFPYPLQENDILITADTVVIVDGQIIGKPTDEAHAAAMIGTISGRCHRVVTGVALRSANHLEVFDAYSDVWLRRLSDEEIRYYVNRYKPMDKAGAYGIQEWIGCTAIERIEGSFYNVMGLPSQKLYESLKKFILL